MTTKIVGRVGPLLLLFVAAACGGCGRQSAPPRADEEAKTGPHGGALVTLPAETVRSAGIVVDSVQSRPIEVTIELPGEIKLNTEHSVDVRPTYPGRVSALSAALGASVQRGESLAVVYSNESLSDYTVVAPMSGTVVARPATVGSVVDASSTLYTVADLGTVWLDFPIYVQHLGRIRRGQLVHVRAESGSGDLVTATIQYVGPLLDASTRTTFGRVVLSNRDARWQPGRLASAVVVLERVSVPLTVPDEAIVRIGSGTAVFRADSSGFELQPVTVGRSDGTTTEIVSGLESGARVVTKNAFLLKAELEKEAGGDED
jgi:cobalt-zinc-cadmium efflux system membrane fusion protein